MAPRGRKPKPTALRVVDGGRAIEGVAPPLARLPPPPAWLRPEAKAEWKRLGSKLIDLGLLSGIDRATFAAYCQAFGTWEAAEKALLAMQKEARKDPSIAAPEMAGLVATTSNGNLIHHPLGVVAQKARLEAVKIAAEFGLTPSSRSRIDTDAAKNRGGADPAEEFF